MVSTIPLKQKPGDNSCVAFVAAMATNTSVDEFRLFCRDFELAATTKPPYEDVHLYAYLLSKGYFCGYSFAFEGGHHFNGADGIKSLSFQATMDLYGTPAYVVVEGPIDKTMDHAIYWDGAQIFDPHPGIRNGRHPSCYIIKAWVPIYRSDEAIT